MTINENLNNYLHAYIDDTNLYYEENIRGNVRYINCCIEACTNFDLFLDLGIGHGLALNILRNKFKQVLVLEGASDLVREYTNKYDNVKVIETYFESFFTKEKFDNIGMGFVLEHVDDPAALLNHFAQFLSSEGRLFIGVPSASSLHRLLAHKAGMITDIEMMTETDFAHGHKRLWSYSKWRAFFENEGFKIETAYGIAFKPFATSQLKSLNLDPKIITALDDLSAHYPELANGLFFVLSKS